MQKDLFQFCLCHEAHQAYSTKLKPALSKSIQAQRLKQKTKTVNKWKKYRTTVVIDTSCRCTTETLTDDFEVLNEANIDPTQDCIESIVYETWGHNEQLVVIAASYHNANDMIVFDTMFTEDLALLAQLLQSDKIRKLTMDSELQLSTLFQSTHTKDMRETMQQLGICLDDCVLCRLNNLREAVKVEMLVDKVTCY